MKVESAVELSGEGYERVITIKTSELQCNRCHKKLKTYDVIFWCLSRHVYCDAKNCQYGNSTGPCEYQYRQVEHEHIRATLRLQALQAIT